METVFAIFYLHVHGYYIIFETDGDWWRFSGESRGFVELLEFVGFVEFVEIGGDSLRWIETGGD
jgi:hypothetical protein